MRGALRISAVLVALMPGVAWADPPNPSFYLVNRSDQSINSFFVSAVSARTWGQDRLGDDTVDPGGNAAIRLLADGTCTFDLRVVYEGGRTEERRNVNTCRVDNISFNGQSSRAQASENTPGHPAPGRDPSFRLVNRGPIEIDELYVREAGSGNWGADRLEDDTLAANDDTVIHIAPGQCVFDVKVVFANHRSTERRRVNLCVVNDMTFP